MVEVKEGGGQAGPQEALRAVEIGHPGCLYGGEDTLTTKTSGLIS